MKYYLYERFTILSCNAQVRVHVFSINCICVALLYALSFGIFFAYLFTVPRMKVLRKNELI